MLILKCNINFTTMIKLFSPTGNRTRAFHVTGGDPHHQTIEEFIVKEVLLGTFFPKQHKKWMVEKCEHKKCARAGARTLDRQVKSLTLYRLSYLGFFRISEIPILQFSLWKYSYSNHFIIHKFTLHVERLIYFKWQR